MRRDFSAFLDLMRLSAAAFVFLAHLSYPRFGGEALASFGPLAHSAVVVFFVLSGFVIAWAAARDGNALDYTTARMARIYSVALPALALTYALDIVTNHTTYQHEHPSKYLPLFLTFTTDWWFLSENAFSDAPYWSLSYEVWYYVVFGILFFGHSRRRYLLAGTVLALTGPRLWLLWPVWMAGAALHRLPDIPWPRLVLVGALSGMIAVKASGADIWLNDIFNAALGGFPVAHLRYSQYAPGDYLFAVFVGLAILAARSADLTALTYVRTPIVAAASISFSLYLIHFPLLLAFSTVFPANPLAIGTATLGGVILFGMVFERNKRVARHIAAACLSPLRWRVLRARKAQ